MGIDSRPLREGVGRNGGSPAERALVWVALYARAWVEITSELLPGSNDFVALYARAWVEILLDVDVGVGYLSPSTRGRG